jgi:hypothetical protein
MKFFAPTDWLISARAYTLIDSFDESTSLKIWIEVNAIHEDWRAVYRASSRSRTGLLRFARAIRVNGRVVLVAATTRPFLPVPVTKTFGSDRDIDRVEHRSGWMYVGRKPILVFDLPFEER